ncbi:uncharacterized protein B0P05DRAFT_546460 [Gilbertella persicaria]|uniref:uncharacterized protein n=1 Tax=Gilbertella persicaria TaxID=101096 RepID=UPI002220F609|nr:uncharacterized protein B0P05DRAFT_546460 [Gilbertella persicaria]KAI8075800.1 hypothetical protein B0P05DRAFT_546460 [Gilbertella persicaria]
MAETKKEGKKPSNRLLGMKFMQRTLEKEKQEQLEKERKRVISEAEWVLDRKEIDAEKPKIQIEHQPSFLPFTQATMAGRQSFKSFNKEIEVHRILFQQKNTVHAYISSFIGSSRR